MWFYVGQGTALLAMGHSRVEAPLTHYDLLVFFDYPGFFVWDDYVLSIFPVVMFPRYLPYGTHPLSTCARFILRTKNDFPHFEASSAFAKESRAESPPLVYHLLSALFHLT